MAYNQKPEDSKRGRKSEVPYRPKKLQMPDSPAPPLVPKGEDSASHDRHVKLLKAECKKSNPNKHVYQELMKRIFSTRREKIVDNSGFSVDRILNEYPAMRYPSEVCFILLYYM